MLSQVLKEIKAFRYIVEADVNYEDLRTCTAVTKHKFLIGKEWKTLGYLTASFTETEYEFNWIDFHLPEASREFFEHRSLDSIKKRISLIWGIDRMLQFEDSLENSKLHFKKSDLER